MSSRLSRVVGRVSAVLLGVTLVLGGLESYYRSRPDEANPHPIRGLYVLDQYSAYALAPNLKRKEFRVHGVATDYKPSVKPFFVSTTADGIRSAKDIVIPRRANTLRIVVMGSSYDFGFGVNDEDTWSAVLERTLAAKQTFPADVEVINGGVPGTHNVQFLIRYLSKLEKYHPDAVLIATGPNVPPGDIDIRSYTPPAPDPDYAARSDFYIDRDGVLRTHVSKNRFWRALSSRSDFVKQMLIRVQVTQNNAQVASAVAAAASDVDDSSLVPFVAFHDRLTARDVPLFVIIRETLLTNKETPSPEEIMTRKLERLGMPSLNLRPLFDVPDYRHFLVDDGHWNEQAHRMAAEAIAEFLAEQKPAILAAAARHGSIPPSK